MLVEVYRTILAYCSLFLKQFDDPLYWELFRNGNYSVLAVPAETEKTGTEEIKLTSSGETRFFFSVLLTEIKQKYKLYTLERFH